ncbi:transporter substrate-binding domain-containing protein [Pseudoalteromonas sp. NFXS39]|uniref:substrate-binding periplasmic protein n=1 Tax=Pseudoalteromonas sp. NFXS39 TaxID=2818437 RepID=UPI0032DFBF15
MNRAAFILLLTFVLWSLQSFAHEQIVIQLAKPNYIEAVKNQYIHDILNKSFAAMDANVVLLYNVKPMNNKRIVEQLSQNKTITLAWLSLPLQQTDSLVKTTIPLYKGLHGQRLLIIRDEDQEKFSSIKTLAELAPLVGLQKQSWSDYTVLKNNDLTVNGELDYPGMIKALKTGLGDYFPRSVLAIDSELNRLKQFNFVIAPNIMLQYPSEYYFYLSRENQHIRDMLEQGMQKLQQSGELDKLYLQYFGDVEKHFSLKQRHRITLNNKE